MLHQFLSFLVGNTPEWHEHRMSARFLECATKAQKTIAVFHLSMAGAPYDCVAWPYDSAHLRCRQPA
jgi:hypothetical protein